MTLKFSEELNIGNLTALSESMRLFIEPAPQTIDALNKYDPNALFIELNGRELIESSEYLNYTWYLTHHTGS